MTDLTWKPASQAPREATNLIIAGIIQCSCAQGGKIVLVAGRMRGQWVIPFEHDLLITHFMELPPHPAIGTEGTA